MEPVLAGITRGKEGTTDSSRAMDAFQEWFFSAQWDAFGRQIAPAGIVAGLCLLFGGLGLSAVLQSVTVRRAFTRLGIDQNLVALVTALLGFGLAVGGVVGGIQTAGIPIAWDAAIPGLGLSVLALFRLVMLLAAVFWLSSVLKRFVFRRFLSTSGLSRSLQYTVAQIIGYLILFLGAAITLQNIGIDLSALALLAGAIGVGIGFGLQNVTSNFISGIILLIERPVEIGDRVEVGDVAGLVSEIRARSTTVVTNDNIAIIISNSKFVEDTVTNWTHADPKIRFRVPVSVAYGSDVEKVRTLLTEVARAHPHALEEPEPSVFFDGFGESSLDFELAVWSQEMSYRPRRFRSDLNFAIERALREAKIEIPFPQRDLHVRTMSARTPGER